MFKKDRKIANQKAMIRNRDKLIERQLEEKVALRKLVSEIKVVANSNLYGSDGKVYLGKIKELIRDFEAKN